jgi:hypothetical protein
MSDIIDFLERMGGDASLRSAMGAELDEALSKAQIDPFVRKAVLAKDQRRLEFILATSSNVCCLIHAPTKGDEDQVEKIKDKASTQHLALAS